MTDFRTDLAALVPRLRRFAWGLAGSRDEGDDLVQAACVKALSRPEQFREGTRLDSWMFRIIQTTWIDRGRSRMRRGVQVQPEDVPDLSDAGLAARLPEDRLTLARVRDAVAGLPEDQRAVVMLVCIEGLSYAETAEALSIPQGTVMSRLARARARLQSLVREE